MTELHPCFGQYVCLRDKPNDKEALLILRKLASQVKPIMRQRGWKVKTLAEFYPDEPNLLGLNVGKTDRILIRLRYPHDPRQFVPFDHTLDTLLHELSHIVWGPHDAKFHALWNELRSEAETLRSQGYSGEGFLTTGNVLGGKRISQDEARRRARTTALAAEKRREQAKRLGKTLGGQGNVSKPQNPKNLRQAMLEAAEKRRTDVTNGCASTNLNEKKKQTLVDQALSNGFKTMAEEEDANDVAIVQAYIELMEEERASQSATGENAEIVDLTQDLDSPAWIDVVFWAVLYRGPWFMEEFLAWSNVSQHAVNSAFALVELFLTRTERPPIFHLLFLIILLALYLALAYVTRAAQGWYTYSFLDPATGGSGRVAAYIFGILAAVVVIFWVLWLLVWLRRWLTESVLGLKGKLNRRDAGAADVEMSTAFSKQFVWPMQDGSAFGTHRACNWLQELPIYDPDKKMTTVKPGATIMLKISTNAHTHEYAKRPSGHYKIYLAGDSGTHITVSSQLTDDRVVFKAPANKYAHIIGDPSSGSFNGDPGFSWLPFKLVDPSGKALPPGVYNFVWTWWWASSAGSKDGSFNDFMVPSYSSCFDVRIDEAAEDAGFLTAYVKNDPNAHVTLIGNTTSPGAKDLTSPWPPYPSGYLTTNYDGGDPNGASAKRSFQPFFKTAIAAVKMPEPLSKRIQPIKAWSKAQLLLAIVSPSGMEPVTEFPKNLTASGFITANGANEIPVTEKLKPLVIGPGSGFGETVFYTNTTDPLLDPKSSNYTMTVSTPLGNGPTGAGGPVQTGQGAFYEKKGSSVSAVSATPTSKGGFYKPQRRGYWAKRSS
ncbi:MAG: hypothetical protein M1814_002033 [Vezdaea aestivalis]|nr:MAG: hypothetical protein M1814_002033 [Vezdaea aestivalis]